MNKSDLIDRIASRANISKIAASSALDAVTDSVTSALNEGNSVTLVGFGTFSVSSRSARMGRNPQTGAPIQIPASRNAKFKAGKALKDSLN